MKKILSLVLVAVMCLAVFCGCSGNDATPDTTKKEVKSLEDLAGLKVAVQSSTTSDDIINDLNKEGKNIEKYPYEKVTQCFDDLALSRVDAVLVDSVVAAYYMGNDSDKFSIAWESSEGEPMAIALQKGADDLTQAVEAAIDTLFYNGKIKELAIKYFGNDFTAGLRNVTSEPVIDKSLVKTMTEGKLTICAEIGYPPMEYLDNDGVSYIGFDIEIGTAIAELLGLEVEFINTSWDGIFESLKKGECDCIISAVSITDDRKEAFNLTEAYVSNKQQIIVAK